MIRLLEHGHYRLIETKRHTKILILNSRSFAWIDAFQYGELLVTSHKTHIPAYTVVNGQYRLYEVKKDRKLTDGAHLELFVGEGRWQGYILQLGLPDDVDRRNKIIPTKELITKSVSHYEDMSAS